MKSYLIRRNIYIRTSKFHKTGLYLTTGSIVNISACFNTSPVVCILWLPFSGGLFACVVYKNIDKTPAINVMSQLQH